MNERELKCLMTAVLLSRCVQRRSAGDIAIEGPLPLDQDIIDDAVEMTNAIYRTVGKSIR